jgi:hypothetical protein
VQEVKALPDISVMLCFGNRAERIKQKGKVDGQFLAMNWTLDSQQRGTYWCIPDQKAPVVELGCCGICSSQSKYV